MNWYLKVLKQYADFNGRARRKEYWMFILINTIISYLILGIATAIDPSFVVLSSIYSLAVLVPTIAVAVRRAHDVGVSGWFMLIPFYNLYLAVKNGDVGPNEYGPDPKNPNDELDEIGSDN
ncbi:DUF805 domain-containing protein [Aquimarina agarilytica]|uniref:DUF805 domain-containing protein n=1 Tax=Aquimarina agarilytica TaxID=1087449 RepID=UPI0002897853|nr:DUF805 domain-containing protein [Aquimarina agarilytica]